MSWVCRKLSKKQDVMGADLLLGQCQKILQKCQAAKEYSMLSQRPGNMISERLASAIQHPRIP